LFPASIVYYHAMGKTKGLYKEEFPKNSTVQIAGRAFLENFLTTWKLHHELEPQQLNYANKIAKVKSVGFYHGGDELYELKGVPGIWHGQCLGAVVETRRRSRWVYFLPTVHLFACMVSFIGLVIPTIQYVGILFSLILIADLPVSIVSYALAWKYGALGTIWIFVAGTLWWYLLSRVGEALLNRFLHRDSQGA
jgi:hypothetical protein